MKTLVVGHGLVEELSCCLRLEDGELPLELLPKLQELTYVGSRDDASDAYTSFVDAHQNAGSPVTLVRRNPISAPFDDLRGWNSYDHIDKRRSWDFHRYLNPALAREPPSSLYISRTALHLSYLCSLPSPSRQYFMWSYSTFSLSIFHIMTLISGSKMSSNYTARPGSLYNACMHLYNFFLLVRGTTVS